MSTSLSRLSTSVFAVIYKIGDKHCCGEMRWPRPIVTRSNLYFTVYDQGGPFAVNLWSGLKYKLCEPLDDLCAASEDVGDHDSPFCVFSCN